MTIKTFTKTRQNKVREFVAKHGLPNPDFKLDNSKRSEIYGFLSGLGLSIAQIRAGGTKMEELCQAYASMTQAGQALGLRRYAPKNVEFDALIIRWNSLGIQTLEIKTGKQETEIKTEKIEMKTELVIEKTENKEPVEKTVEALSKMLLSLMASTASKPAELDESKVVDLIKKHAQATKLEIKIGKEIKEIETGLHHEALPKVIKLLSAGVNVLMVGGAGSGKTTIAEQAAKALDLQFYFNGALSSEYKLSGFIDAQGKLVSTVFRQAYEHGGVYLFDEVDGSMPDALLAFNAALSNGHADFPDGRINRHKDFHCVAAANTYGMGADRLYVGRNQLDAASLDRFAVIVVDYDEKLERTVAANDDWVNRVQKIRQAVNEFKIRHIVSPRASIQGAKLLAAGFKEHEVEEMVIWKGIDKDSKTKIIAKIGG